MLNATRLIARLARSAWFPDPQGQTTSTITMGSKVLSIEDQPASSRVHTPSVDAQRPPSAAANPANGNGSRDPSFQQSHAGGPYTYPQPAMELSEKVPGPDTQHYSPRSPSDAQLQQHQQQQDTSQRFAMAH